MKNVLIFLAGAGIGSVITWKLIEKKYKDLADEEIESVKEVFKRREEERKTVVKEITDENKETKKITKKSGKNKKEKTVEDIIVEEKYIVDSPIKIIKEEEYGQLDDYEMCSGLYYADGKLTLDDVEEEPIDDPTDYIGHALDEFVDNKYLEQVFVRNDDRKCDYEILRSEKNFSDLFV